MAELEALEALLEDSLSRAGEGARRAWAQARPMSPLAVRTFLREQRFCALATTSPGGDPHLVPVGFLYLDDTSFWLPTGAGAVRLADLRKRPRAALMVGQGVGAQHQLVLVRGAVRIHPGQDLPGVVAKAAGEKLGDTDWASSWLELRPTSLLAYSG